MVKALNPGELKQRITFLNPPNSEDKDDYGDPLDIWTLYKSTWAAKEPLLGRDFYSALTADSKVEVKFRMRFIVGVTDVMRIQHNQDTYKIISAIDVDSAHKELLCYCRLVK